MFDNKKLKYATFYIIGAAVLLMIANFVLVDMKTQAIKYNDFLKLLS